MFFIALLVVALLVTSSVAAQDKLVKRTGEEMKVKVLSVSKTKVKFVRQGTDAPVYTLPVSDIQYIEYPTGDRDTFGAEPAKPAVAEKSGTGRDRWLGPVPTPDGRLSVSFEEATANSEQQIYKIGDIYRKNSLRASIFSTVPLMRAASFTAPNHITCVKPSPSANSPLFVQNV